MRLTLLALPLLLAVLTAPFAAHADELRPFCADRPGKATPPCILDAGHVQVETALADAVFLHGRGPHEDLTTYGATEVRFGLTERLEIEAAWTPAIVDRVRGAGSVTGSGDATFGFRYALTDAKNEAAVQVSIQPYVNAPTATHGLGEGGWSGGFRAPIAKPLPNDFIVALTPEIDIVRNADGGGTHLAESAALSIGRGFGDTTLAVEFWGQNDGEPGHSVRQATIGLTGAQLIGKNSQLDAGVAFGLNRDTPSSEVYIGVSHRF